MQAIWNNVVIAESDATEIVEGNHYFPFNSIKSEFFTKTELTTVCGWKGKANYYSVTVEGKTNKDCAWYYAEPNDAANKIKGMVAFWNGIEINGKVKDLYDVDENSLLFKFSDRVSAYDVKFSQDIPKKGQVLCHFAEFWFDKLDVPNHFIKRESETEISVKKMKMIPMECVVRGYFYGSLIGRWKKGSIQLPENTDTQMAAKLTKPLFDPTTKSEHDIPVDKSKALEMNLVSEEQYDWLEQTSIDIYNQMSAVADNAGFILADLKLEFGILDGDIVLGDSIGPDEYRLWPKEFYTVGEIQESYDKQILRDWLTANGYQKQFDDERNAGNEPTAPQIPSKIIQTITERYVIAFEKLTGQTL